MSSNRYEVPRGPIAGSSQPGKPVGKKKRKPGEVSSRNRYARQIHTRQRQRGQSVDPRPSTESVATNARRVQPQQRRRRPTGFEVHADPTKCQSAVAQLSQFSRIAVDCEGVQLSRTGRLCLLQMASPDCIYVFDLIGDNPDDDGWGKRFFEVSGLKKLLESPRVHKVMHDCRHDSDALFHQFGVKLGPVIDTQVVFSVLRRVRGMEVGLPVSLRTLLKKFAGASEEQLFMKNAVKDIMRDDGDYWLRRPLSPEALQYARLDVEYLLSVTKQLANYIDGADKHGWQDVLKASQDYLTVFRDDEDGPRKAQQQYEQMARVARRQRVAFDHTRRVQTHQNNDPMRRFVFDTSRVLEALSVSY